MLMIFFVDDFRLTLNIYKFTVYIRNVSLSAGYEDFVNIYKERNKVTSQGSRFNEMSEIFHCS